jgi:hypothetical protein
MLAAPHAGSVAAALKIVGACRPEQIQAEHIAMATQQCRRMQFSLTTMGWLR